MLPVAATLDRPDGAGTDAIALCQRFRHTAPTGYRANGSHILGCQLGVLDSLSSRLPLFRVTIAHIVNERAEKQVIRPHAGRVVTVVTDHQSVRNRAIRQFIRKTVRACSSSVCAQSKQPVSETSCATRPYPAALRITLVHLCPEGFGQRLSLRHPRAFAGTVWAGLGSLTNEDTPTRRAVNRHSISMRLITAGAGTEALFRAANKCLATRRADGGLMNDC